MTRFVFAFLCLLPALWAAAQTNGRPSGARIVTLNDFIGRVTAAHPGFEEILVDQLKLKYRKAASLSSDDIRVSILPEYALSWNGTNTGSASGTVNLSKLFRGTGTELSGGYGLAEKSGTLSSSFNVSVVQPLLQNALGVQNRLEEQLADLAVRESEILVAEAYEEYLAALIDLYGSWATAHSARRSASNSLVLKEKLGQDVQNRRANRIALESDVLQSDRQVLLGRANANAADAGYENVMNQVRIAIGADPAETILPDPGSVLRTDLRNFREEWNAFRSESRTWRLYGILLSQASNRADQAFQNILPAANLEAGYSLKGNGVLPWENPSHGFAVGFSLSFPVGSTRENALLETARLDARKQKLANENRGVQLEQNLYRLHVLIRSAEERLRIAGDRLQISRRLVQEQDRRFRQGLATLGDYISALDGRDQDEASVTALQIELNGLTLDWLRLTDRLVRKTSDGLLEPSVR